MDDSALASNPGRISISWLRWLRHYPRWPLTWALGFLSFGALAWYLHWFFWIPTSLFMLMNILYWIRIGEHFQNGCANPGVVISLDPMLIAVSTDLTYGREPCPVIKIIQKEMSQIAGEAPFIGARLPTVALYEHNVEKGAWYWADCDPRPVECASRDLRDVKRLMETFVGKEWRELEHGLAELEKPHRPGLFHVSIMDD